MDELIRIGYPDARPGGLKHATVQELRRHNAKGSWLQGGWYVGWFWPLVWSLAVGTPVVNDGLTTSAGIRPEDLVLVRGGTFQMGDVFGEGDADERPVHLVTLTNFHLQRHEVTVAQFRSFVEEAGYRTSAEGPMDLEAHKKIMEEVVSGTLTDQERGRLHQRILGLSGSGSWDAAARAWKGYNPHTNWRTPDFVQAETHPVVAVSWDDAIHYCNWLSRRAGLPPAYDEDSGALLDEDGEPTADITRVKGYRLPTEAEWEYAAREGGREVRFGNGENIARSSEIVFNADVGVRGSSHVARSSRTTGSLYPRAQCESDRSGECVEDGVGSGQVGGLSCGPGCGSERHHGEGRNTGSASHEAGPLFE